jgi:hypothetical protein
MQYHLTPAYGRDYTSKAAILADFNADKDFLLDGKPINKAQLIELGVKSVNVRYKQLRNVAVVSVTFNGK